MKNLCAFLFLTIIFISSCNDKKETNLNEELVFTVAKQIAEQKVMEAKMKEHLEAVTNRDLTTLKSTLTPSGKMQLILPGSEIMQTNEEFMKYHEEWFADTTTWTFETKILNSKTSPLQGMSVVEVLYKEPERNGMPYFNRMIVSYDLEKIDGKWYVMKDHASSVEKSTDKK